MPSIKRSRRSLAWPISWLNTGWEAITEGLDSIADVTLRIEHEGTTYIGRGADTDIVVASAKAYVDSLNRLLSTKQRATSIIV